MTSPTTRQVRAAIVAVLARGIMTPRLQDVVAQRFMLDAPAVRTGFHAAYARAIEDLAVRGRVATDPLLGYVLQSRAAAIAAALDAAGWPGAASDLPSDDTVAAIVGRLLAEGDDEAADDVERIARSVAEGWR